jgi:hypothetical protein
MKDLNTRKPLKLPITYTIRGIARRPEQVIDLQANYDTFSQRKVSAFGYCDRSKAPGSKWAFE